MNEARARYDECMTRKPFLHHVQGREALAKSRDAAALAQLQTDYAKVKQYPDYARYTMASQLGRYFNGDEFLPVLAQMRAKHNKPIDTWLWVETLTNETNRKGPEEAIRVAQTAKKAHLRAAAIAALGQASSPDLKAAFVTNCIEFPRKGADRMVLLGAMTGALFENKDRVNDEDYREALKAYISLLNKDVKLSHTAKVQMARHLQVILNGPAQFINPEPWLELLNRGEVKKPKDYGTSASPKFFGIETEGERFCYVVDMSDSMLKEIVPSARPKGPITGPKKKKKKKSMVLDEGDLPWHEIHTRWDLAREQLRISLSRLSSDKYFSIVWFGDDAGTLNSTKGMVKASKGNIQKAMAELDGIGATTDKEGKEVLRGKTSLHYGLSVAFSLGKRGPADEPVYVGAKPLTEGCDTIFLLSDGAPNWDAFDINDKNYGEGQTYKDLEAGIKAAPPPTVTYHGPYANFPKLTGFRIGSNSPRSINSWLLRDVLRMNAFRRIKVHCVGLGEANEELLNWLAAAGNGDVFIVEIGRASCRERV